MSMSDRNQPATPTKVKSPELVNTKQTMAVRTTAGVPKTDDGPKKTKLLPAALNHEQLPAPAADLPSLEQPPQQFQLNDGSAEPISKPASALEPSEDVRAMGVSSRRESKPEPMQIRIEGEPISSPSPPRQPLLPMLASASGRSKMPEQVTLPVSSQPQLKQQTQPAAIPTSNLKTASSVNKEVRVMVKGSIALQSTDTIQALSVEHEDICQVIQTAGKSYTLIGLRPGETRIAVISESAGQRNIQIHQVTVADAQPPQQNSSSTIAQTIQQLYPRSKVRVATRGTQLVVGGNVESEETAKEILRLVRKTTLTPVVDELQVR
jgi:hypothetical protein